RALLVRPDELTLRDHVAAHRLLEGGLRGLSEVRQDGIERVHLEEIAVAPLGRARAPPADLAKIALSVAHAAADRRRGLRALRDRPRRRRDIVEHPMHEDLLRSGGVG